MAKKDNVDTEAPSKGGGLMSTILALLIITGLGVGAGGLFGIQAAQKLGAPAKPANAPANPAPAGHGSDKSHDKPAKKEHGKEAKDAKGEKPFGPRLVILPNIVTNLAYPERMWIRLDAAAVIEDENPDKLAAMLAEDILAYLRTVKLEQIQGGSGYQYLREDLDERVRLRGQGKVRDFILQSFILE